jgi:hypothetical protein
MRLESNFNGSSRFSIVVFSSVLSIVPAYCLLRTKLVPDKSSSKSPLLLIGLQGSIVLFCILILNLNHFNFIIRDC